MTQPLRTWELANLKRETENGRCRVCRTSSRVELAHVIGRKVDQNDLYGVRVEKPWVVFPTRVVPLCGPATDTGTCHNLHDTHRLELLPYLTLDEQTQAVRDAGGLELARVRLCPSAYGSQKVAA